MRQGLFRLFPLGDIPHECAMTFHLVITDKHHIDFDRNEPAVFGPMMPLKEIPAPSLHIVPKGRPPVGLEFRIDVMHCHAAKLVFRVTQHVAGGIVRIQQLRTGPYPVNRLCGVIDRVFGEVQRLFGSFALGDVLHHRQRMACATSGIPYDRESHLRPHDLSVFSDIAFLEDVAVGRPFHQFLDPFKILAQVVGVRERYGRSGRRSTSRPSHSDTQRGTAPHSS